MLTVPMALQQGVIVSSPMEGILMCGTLAHFFLVASHSIRHGMISVLIFLVVLEVVFLSLGKCLKLIFLPRASPWCGLQRLPLGHLSVFIPVTPSVSGIQGQPWLLAEFKASLCYKRLCFWTKSCVGLDNLELLITPSHSTGLTVGYTGFGRMTRQHSKVGTPSSTWIQWSSFGLFPWKVISHP